ncbi:uncharacterized protein LOC143222156 isoform X2 [Tachypleus tridentatus]|uniref:uncharacterized protein LOC143222156 isoform X2 n=1 Tax=Tachypleus tridentatus TaxID=6853 RepID=UPI003FD4FBC0
MKILLFNYNTLSSTQECNMNQAINRTTECTRTFSKRIGSSTQSLTKNPEKLCWSFCKLEACQTNAAEETGCTEPAQFFIENSLEVSRILLQKQFKVNCKDYNTLCGRSSMFKSNGSSLVFAFLLTKWF